jgi:hypothetical protein
MINMWQCFTVNPALLIVFGVGQALFLGAKAVQHYRGDTTYRLNADPYLTLEQLTVASITSVTLLIAGVMM